MPMVWLQPESASNDVQALVAQDDRVILAQNPDDLFQVFSMNGFLGTSAYMPTASLQSLL